jgi:hypothetical protein
MNRTFTAFVLSSMISAPLVVQSAAAEPPKAPAPPVAGKVPLGLTVAETELVATGWRGSKLIGAEVRTDKVEQVGKIDDIIVTPSGALSMVIIEVGGFLGLGAHLVAIPMRQLVLSTNAPKIVLPGATKATLKALPEFKYAS